jgi:hypothetical protein
MIPALGTPMTRVERVGLITGLLLVLALMWPVRHYLTDDTFIHLQYARHLHQGRGLVFNLGERVYGCTSPLWVTLIADGMVLGLDGLTVARLLGVVSTLASVGLFLQLMRRMVRSPELRALATVAWASHAWMLRWSVSGMEAPLAVALTLAGFVALTEGKEWGSRPVRTGALWGLAALTRPEVVFLMLLWCVALIIDAQNRAGLRRLVFGMLPPLLIYGTWLLFARVFFGTFWPLTLSAKAAGVGGLAAHLAGLWRQVKIAGATDGVPLLVLAVSLLAGSLRRPRLRPGAMDLLPWVWVLALPMLYVARGVPVVSRYLLIVLPVAQALAWRTFESVFLGHEGAARARAYALGGAIAALTIVQNLTVYRTVVLPQVVSFTHGLEVSLVTWGKWFGRHVEAGATIATPDIGAIGYFSRARIFDLAGLVTPKMVPLIEREPWEDALANLRFAGFARPSYVVDRAPLADDLLRRSPYAPAFTPLGHAKVPNLGIAIPGEVVYTFYRVDWPTFERTRLRR